MYRAFHLRRLSLWSLLAPRVLARYWNLLREGRKLQRYGKEDVFQGGGDFLVLPDGRVPYSHRSDDPADRPSLGMLKHEIVTGLARAGL